MRNVARAQIGFRVLIAKDRKINFFGCCNDSYRLLGMEQSLRENRLTLRENTVILDLNSRGRIPSVTESQSNESQLKTLNVSCYQFPFII